MKLSINTVLVRSLIGVAASIRTESLDYQAQVDELVKPLQADQIQPEVQPEPTVEKPKSAFDMFADAAKDISETSLFNTLLGAVVPKLTNKIVTFSHTETEVTLELNDDFIIDVAETLAQVAVKAMPVAVSYCRYTIESIPLLNSLEKRWKDEPIVDEVDVSVQSV